MCTQHLARLSLQHTINIYKLCSNLKAAWDVLGALFGFQKQNAKGWSLRDVGNQTFNTQNSKTSSPKQLSFHFGTEIRVYIVRMAARWSEA